MKLSTILVAVVATVATHSAMASDFYRWVDKNGTTHYTKTPPPKGAKVVGKTETYAVPVYTKPTVYVEQTQPIQHQPVVQQPVATEVAQPQQPVVIQQPTVYTPPTPSTSYSQPVISEPSVVPPAVILR